MGGEKRLIRTGIGLGDAVQNRSTRSPAQTGDSVLYHSLRLTVWLCIRGSFFVM
jgi:hypothetical protein